jgi:hypothetical protein
MAGLVPAIHVFSSHHRQIVDARHKAGHDKGMGFEKPSPQKPHAKPR